MAAPNWVLKPKASNCFLNNSIRRSSIGDDVLEDLWGMRPVFEAILEAGEEVYERDRARSVGKHAPMTNATLEDNDVCLDHSFWTMERLKGRLPDISTCSLLLPSCRSRYSLIAWTSRRSTPFS